MVGVVAATGSRGRKLLKAAHSGEKCVVSDARLRGHTPGTGEVGNDNDAPFGRVLPKVSGMERDSVAVRLVP